MNNGEIKSDKIVNKRGFYRRASKRRVEMSKISGVFRLLWNSTVPRAAGRSRAPDSRRRRVCKAAPARRPEFPRMGPQLLDQRFEEGEMGAAQDNGVYTTCQCGRTGDDADVAGPLGCPGNPASMYSTSPGQGRGTTRHTEENRSMSAQNFSSRKVTLVAMTRMRPPACRSRPASGPAPCR